VPTLEEITGTAKKGLSLEEITGGGEESNKPYFSPGGSGDFRGAGASASFAPQARRPAMRGQPDQGFSPERSLESMPLVSAVAASFLQPEVGIPALARLGFGGKALQFLVNSVARIGTQAGAAGATRTGVEMVKGATPVEAMQAGGEEAKGVAKAAAIGEGAGAVLTGLGAAKPMLKTLLKKTPAGEKYGETIRTAITEQAQQDANAIVSQVADAAPSELIGEQAGAMARKFDKITIHKATALREIPIQTAVAAKLKVDISPILQDLKGMLTATEQSAGALSPLAGAEARALEVTEGARVGTKPTEPLTEGLRQAKGALMTPEVSKMVSDFGDQLRAILKAKTASTAALMEVQGTTSQLLASENIPFSLRRVLQKIGGDDPLNPTARINGVIRGSLSRVGDDAVASWDTALGYYGKIQDVKEQALYGLIKKTPEKVHAYIAPNQPATSNTLRKMISETGDADLLPRVQRKWLEDRVAKRGVTGVREEIESYGEKTVGNLMREPKAAAAVENVKQLSDSLNSRLNAVGVGAEKTRDVLAEAAMKAGLSQIPGGRLVSALTPDMLVRWAYKPEAKQIVTMVKGISPDATPRTIDALAQLMRRANQMREEDRDAAQAR